MPSSLSVRPRDTPNVRSDGTGTPDQNKGKLYRPLWYTPLILGRANVHAPRNEQYCNPSRESATSDDVRSSETKFGLLVSSGGSI